MNKKIYKPAKLLLIETNDFEYRIQCFVAFKIQNGKNCYIKIIRIVLFFKIFLEYFFSLKQIGFLTFCVFLLIMSFKVFGLIAFRLHSFSEQFWKT
jgi:hypothetical protein